MKITAFLEKLLSYADNSSMILCKYHQRKEKFSNLNDLKYLIVTYVEKGNLNVKTDQKEFNLAQGNLLFITPIKKRTYSNLTNNEVKYFNLQVEILKSTSLENEEVLIHTNQLSISSYFYKLLDLHMRPNKYRDSIFKGVWLQLIPDLINENTSSREKTNHLNYKQRRAIQEYIANNIHKKIAAKDLAKLVKLSHDYFTRQFKKTYKLPPKSYIKKMKMERAAELLSDTQLNINEIAYSIGIHDNSLFSLQFKDIFKATPQAYRKNILESNPEFK